MTYRDDRDALKDRIEFLEGQLAKQVSPEQLDVFRSEVAELKDRLFGEQQRLEAISNQLTTSVDSEKKSDQSLRPMFMAMGILVVMSGLAALISQARYGAQQNYPALPTAQIPRPQSVVVQPRWTDLPVIAVESLDVSLELTRSQLNQCRTPGSFRGTFTVSFETSGSVEAVSARSNQPGSQQERCVINALNTLQVLPLSRSASVELEIMWNEP